MLEPVIVIGGGPAGLTAAYELAAAGRQPVVLEKDALVGGLARTQRYRGFLFDMGGHRFFTKSEEVKALWNEVLGDQLLLRPRMSRIYYKQRYFAYPLKLIDVVRGLGVLESARILFSYCCSKLRPHHPEISFRHWVSNRFGARLFDTFFCSYTEKVWGISTDELDAEWAVQRIKNLSLRSAVMGALIKPGTKITSLIEQFHYPRQGPGMMWEAMSRRVEEMGGEVHLRTEVVKILREGSNVTGVVVAGPEGQRTIASRQIISSMPITELIDRLQPAAAADVRGAAGQMSYRDFLTVCLIVNQPSLFPDNWIYIHEPDVKVARIQNFKNWSGDMVPDQSKTSLGLEYFCQEGDEFWNTPDEELIELAKREIERLRIARSAEVESGCVFRMPKAYPVYDNSYRDHMDTLRDYIHTFENLQTIGRNGLHRYNNQDHAMLTGMLAARNVINGTRYNLWDVNADQAYHETISGADPALAVARQNGQPVGEKAPTGPFEPAFGRGRPTTSPDGASSLGC
jgi:protoporphyrinogen oxidase